MGEIARSAWETAALAMFDDEYALVSVGPRTHESWAQDAALVMRRDAEDPRGWVTLDWDAENRAERPYAERQFPFVGVSAGKLAAKTHRISVHAARKQLVAMIDDWFSVTSIPGFDARSGHLLEQAGKLLSRFGEGVECYTTSSVARVTTDPDAYSYPSAGYSFTDYTMDLGLIAVSRWEVGVFWRFNPV